MLFVSTLELAMPADNQNNQNSNQNDYVSNITEIPITETQDDLLNSKCFTDGLIDYIEHANTPFSISLNGEWGSGKTSIMNAVKKELCDKDNAKFHGIYVNTWQFSLLDSSSAPQAVVRILQSIVNQILRLKPDYERRKQISQLIGALATISSGLKSFSDAAGDPLFGVGKSTFGLIEKASNALNKHFNTNSNQAQTDNAALVKQLSGEIQKLVDEVLTAPKSQDGHYEPYNPYLTSEPPNYPCAKFVYFVCICLCNLSTILIFIPYYLGLMFFNVIFGFIGRIVLSIVNSFSITKALFDFCCYMVRTGDAIFCNDKWSKISEKDGFVFFIDDLDRINPTMALEIVEFLESIFNFKNCVFVLAVDKSVLLKSAELKLTERNIVNPKSDTKTLHAKCQQYLNRIVHTSVDVPKKNYNIKPLLRESFLKISFFTVEELSDDKNLGFLEYITFNLIGKNPRTIKQVINQLSLLDTLRRYQCPVDKNDKTVPGQVDLIFKKLIFVIQCIMVSYPKLIILLHTAPNFKKEWTYEYAKQFNVNEPNATKDEFKQMIIYSNVEEWEYVVFFMCDFDKYTLQEFYRVKDAVKCIEEIFDEYINKYCLPMPLEFKYTICKWIMQETFLRYYQSTISKRDDYTAK